MNMKNILNWLSEPGNLDTLLTALCLLAGAVVTILGKLGWASAAQVKKAEKLLNEGATVSEITDKTKLVVAEVEAIHAEVKAPDGVVDTNRKKIQRTVRAILKGFLLK